MFLKNGIRLGKWALHPAAFPVGEIGGHIWHYHYGHIRTVISGLRDAGVPAFTFKRRISGSPFGHAVSLKKSIEDTLQHHDAGHGYCWDYVLTLTRQEFEVCKYLMQAHEGMTIFEAWDTWIQPRNTRMTRRETLCCS